MKLKKRQEQSKKVNLLMDCDLRNKEILVFHGIILRSDLDFNIFVNSFRCHSRGKEIKMKVSIYLGLSF